MLVHIGFHSFLQAERLANIAQNNPEILEPVIAQLADATERKSISILPTDLNTTNNVVGTAITSLESNLEKGAISQQEVSLLAES